MMCIAKNNYRPFHKEETVVAIGLLGRFIHRMWHTLRVKNEFLSNELWPSACDKQFTCFQTAGFIHEVLKCIRARGGRNVGFTIGFRLRSKLNGFWRVLLHGVEAQEFTVAVQKRVDKKLHSCYFSIEKGTALRRPKVAQQMLL